MFINIPNNCAENRLILVCLEKRVISLEKDLNLSEILLVKKQFDCQRKSDELSVGL